MRISDISVSRVHAHIKFENGQFVLVDNNSKFGTLVLLKKPHNVTTEKIAIQVGRTVVTFALKKNHPVVPVPTEHRFEVQRLEPHQNQHQLQRAIAHPGQPKRVLKDGKIVVSEEIVYYSNGPQNVVAGPAAQANRVVMGAPATVDKNAGYPVHYYK